MLTCITQKYRSTRSTSKPFPKQKTQHTIERNICRNREKKTEAQIGSQKNKQ